jgi:hypothetical protein
MSRIVILPYRMNDTLGITLSLSPISGQGVFAERFFRAGETVAQ